MPVIIIRATQRLMISRAVEQHVGRDRRSRRSSVSSGQPRVANGHSADENQVSSTSGSRSSSLPPQVGQRVGRRLLHDRVAAAQYQTGQLVAPPELAGTRTSRGSPPSSRRRSARRPSGGSARRRSRTARDGRRGQLVHAAEPLQRDAAARCACRSGRSAPPCARTARSSRSRPCSSQIRHAPRSRASAAVEPGVALPGLVGHAHRRSRSPSISAGRGAARSRSRSGRGAGVILRAPVPNATST